MISFILCSFWWMFLKMWSTSDLPGQNSACFSFNFAPITPSPPTRSTLCKTPKAAGCVLNLAYSPFSVMLTTAVFSQGPWAFLQLYWEVQQAYWWICHHRLLIRPSTSMLNFLLASPTSFTMQDTCPLTFVCSVFLVRALHTYFSDLILSLVSLLVHM